jgi:AcrR family transcriptional regulator
VPRTGRRPGAGGTDEKILAAARAHFARVGFEGGTVRGIAAESSVDPSLVLHYFGSKEGLFRAAVDFPVDPAAFIPRLLAPGLDGLGERLVRFFLETWDSPAGRPLLALVRSVVASEDAAALLREFVGREVLGRLARALEVDQPQLRASLAASTLIGMAMLRYVIKLEPLASAKPEVVAGWLGPAVQRYLTDPDVTVGRRKPRIESMAPTAEASLTDQLGKIPAAVRPTVKAAIKLVKQVAPKAEEIPYRSQAPRSKSMMWKLVRYSVDGDKVLGIGTFTNHSALFFYRGRELEDATGLLQGSGKDSRFVTLRSPADVERPAVKRLVRAAFKLGEAAG